MMRIQSKISFIKLKNFSRCKQTDENSNEKKDHYTQNRNQCSNDQTNKENLIPIEQYFPDNIHQQPEID